MPKAEEACRVRQGFGLKYSIVVVAGMGGHPWSRTCDDSPHSDHRHGILKENKQHAERDTVGGKCENCSCKCHADWHMQQSPQRDDDPGSKNAQRHQDTKEAKRNQVGESLADPKERKLQCL